MNDCARQSLVRPIGSVAVGESPWISKRIIGSKQPRPFLLSPEKKTADVNTKSRVKLKIPIGFADSRNGGHTTKVQNSNPKYSAQNSPGLVGERQRKISLKKCKEPEKIMELEKPCHSIYVPTTMDLSNPQTPVEPPPKLAQNPSIVKKSELSPGLISVKSLTRPLSTSSAGSIPDFPLPLAIDSNRRCSPSLRSSNQNRAFLSSYSQASLLQSPVKESFHSKNISFQSYASSDVMPSLCSESYDILSSIQTGKGTENKVEMALKTRPHNNYQFNNFGSPIVCSKEELCLPEIVFESDSGLLSPPTPRFSYETRLYNRPRGLDGKNRFNSNLPLVSGSELSDFKEAEEKEYIGSDPNNVDDCFFLISGSDSRNLSPNPPKCYQVPEKRRSACSNINKLCKPESKETTASLPDIICHLTKLAPFIDHEKTLKTKAQSKNNLDQKNFGNEARKKPHTFGFSRLPGSLLAVSHSRVKSPGKIIHRATYFERSNGLDDMLESDEESTTNNLRTRERRKRVKFWYFSLPGKHFIALMIILAIILAAVIFIPIFIFTFRRPNHKIYSNSLESCDTSVVTKCQNGGSSFLLDDKTCACLCTNGFIGNTCTINMSSTVYSILKIGDHNATLGSAVKRLIEDSHNKFGIPLNPSLILARLNSANLSFLAENALVTFNGKSFSEDYQRKDLGRSRIPKKILGFETIKTEHSISGTPSDSSTSSESTITVYVTISSFSPTMKPGATNTTTTILPTITPIASSSNIPSNPDIETSQISQTNSTCLISSSASTSLAMTMTTTTVTATSTVTTSNTPSSLPSYFIPNEITLEFARVVTLYVMQKISLNEALNVQSSLQHIFSKKAIAYNLAKNTTLNTFSSHVTVNLIQSTLDLGNGKGILGGYKNRE
ncbi:hypothetical protein GcM3_004014 [Golovinomyces cichoracearum]|uniref:EGF-like domain-containing protein n=1 Tax=Golovinomyces cichoracearum TaxID=62708 RepID=A0A420JB05_9PEZI|nr:hypothetical protein GcM3_004014 [Golovinomyces cichoracearum]